MLKTTMATVLAAALLAAGCQDKQRSQVMVSLITDINAPDPLQNVKMKIDRFEAGAFVPVDGHLTPEAWAISGQSNVPNELPGSFVLFSDPGAAPLVRVTVNAIKGTSNFVERSSVFRLVPDQTIFVRLSLADSCTGNADCPSALTCVEGRCRKPEIDSKFLPRYEPGADQETTIACNSGTAWRNTSSKMTLEPAAATCPEGELCVEGTCYRPEVFELPATTRVQPLTLDVRVTDPAGVQIPGAQVRIEDGPLTLIRRLKGGRPPVQLAQALTAEAPATDVMGRASATSTFAALTEEVRVTVTAPGRAPQVAVVPVKPDVTRYLVPIVMFPMVERTITGPSQQVEFGSVGGRTAVVETGSSGVPVRIRLAMIDPQFAPGQPVGSSRVGLLQSSALLYVETVDMMGASTGAVPNGLRVSLGSKTEAPVEGTAATASALQMDLQAHWKGEGEVPVSGSDMGSTFSPAAPGLWTVAKKTMTAGCARGKVVRRDNKQPCPGARVRLLGPDGVSSFDSSGADGSFCAAAARKAPAIVAVGRSTRAIYVPDKAGVCSATADDCVALGDIEVDPVDCQEAPAIPAGRRAVTEACGDTLECGPVASCYEGVCVGEGHVRVSMTWTTGADLDLQVILPGDTDANPRRIGQKARELGGGKLDVEQCSNGCQTGKHVENIVFPNGAPAGMYRAVIENFSGSRTVETATVEVFVNGTRVSSEMVMVGAGAGSVSARGVMFEVK